VNAASVTLAGDLALPATTSLTAGVITLGGVPFAHRFGTLENTFLGSNAGNFTMTGGFNTATGYAALGNNTTGVNNTAYGGGALYYNTTGYQNTAIGLNALDINTTGYDNTAIGLFALGLNSSGYHNLAAGFEALYNNTMGFYNTAVGYHALYNNTTGADNIGLGAFAGYQLTTGHHNIDVANQGVAGESSTIRIGTSGTHTKAFIAGISGVTTGGAGVAVVVDANGQLGTGISSRRYKFDIAAMGSSTDDLMRLRPVTFRYLAHGENAPLQYGLIAEEVAEVYPELVARNKDGEVETVMYQFLAPMLLNEVQKQHQRIEEQQAENKTLGQRTAELQADNAALRNQLEKLMRRVDQLEVKHTATQ
jgi:hypothetical protein